MQGQRVVPMSKLFSIQSIFKLSKDIVFLSALGFGLTACSGSSGGLPPAAPDDILGPKVVSIDPLLNAVDVDINSSRITVVFDEELNQDNSLLLPFSVTITPTASTVGKTVNALDVTSIPRIEGNKLIINFLNGSLVKETFYQIDIRELEDTNGNVMDSYTSTFSTTSPPVATIKPLDKSIPVSRAEQITVEFNEVMDEASLAAGFELLETQANATNTTSYKFLDSASPLQLTHNIIDNKSIATYSLVDPTNPATAKLLAKSAQYTVRLSASQAQPVTDANGNPLALTSVSFSTGVSDKIGFPPSKPGKVSVNTSQSGSVSNNNISWLPATPSSGRTMVYNLYVSINGGTFQQITLNQEPLAQTIYTDPSVTVGTKYIYAVSAMEVIGTDPINYGAESQFSYSDEIIPGAKPPARLTAIAGPAISSTGSQIADGVLELTWDSVIGRTYNLYVKKGTSPFVKLTTQSISATAVQTSYPLVKDSYTPGNDVNYQYGVSVLAPNGTTESIKTLSATVTPFTAPAVITPSGIDQSITLTWPLWKNVAGLSYSIYASINGGAFNQVASNIKGGTYIHGSGAVGSNNPPLTYDLAYRYKVAAVSTVGSVVRTSVQSASSISVTLLAPAAKPTAPTSATATAGDSSVLVTWDIASGNNYDYRIYQKQGTTGTFGLVKTLINPSVGSARISAVNNTLNTFQIAAVTANIEGTRAETAGVTPQPATDLSISAWNHSCFVKSGELTCWGENIYGQIGDGTTTYAKQKTTITAPNGSLWRAVATGERHTCGIVDTGAMYCWGEPSNGQLGNGDRLTRVLSPKLVLKPAALPATETVSWVQVTAGSFTTCGIQSNGTGNGQLFCWGNNSYDQLGIASQSTTNVLQPEPVIPAPGLSPDTDWTEVRAAERHTCGIRQQAGNNTLWCWGSRRNGRLGDGNSSGTSVELQQVISGTGGLPDTDWTSLALGNSHTCGVRGTANTVWCWGRDSVGQIGNSNAGFSNTIPLQESTFATDWVKVFANNDQTCGLKLSGKISCWGANYLGQSGNGTVSRFELIPTTFADTTSTWSSIAVGKNHTCAIRTNPAPVDVLCWGTAEKFALGTTTSETSTPVQVGTATDWVTASAGTQNVAGFMFTLGLRGASIDVNQLYGWGSNQNGILGNGDGTFLPAQVPSAAIDIASWKKISTGNTHACGIKSNGTLYCWGSGGQLGNGAFDTANPTLVGTTADTWLTVDAGAQHSCAIKTDGSLLCWGYGANGELGNGTSTSSDTPIAVTNPTTTTAWSSVSAGLFYTCAVDTAGKLYCWGINQTGNLGLGDQLTRNVPTEVINPGGVASSWKSISAGTNTTCAINDSGNQNLYCWGSNVFGTVGNPTSSLPDQLTPLVVQTVSDTTASATPWTAVSLSHVNACARKNDSASSLAEEGSLWCWGHNFNGEIGKGDFDIAPTTDATARQRRMVPTRVFPGNALTTATIWKDFTAGSYHSCAIKALDNTLWCWGSNSGGQLGTGKAWSLSPVPLNIP